MSTFDGIVEEFPDIRIDYFRHHPGKVPPAACFLSHIHSDHLLGLETLKMPFVYCSAATRRVLLKMEKYPHRINFSKGILEARKQTYKHLKLILRPLPLNTPTELELGPKSRIQVTLFDANHCPGAVMFLIESDGRAILYTGDIRSEAWWVNSLVRNPVLIPYAMGQKRLDCMYLDTTFASHHDIHREFPSKAEGLNELMSKVKQHSDETIFYFRAWTLGYEDIWISLSKMLNSQIHIDPYQMRLFRGVAEDGLGADPGPALVGFQVGNGEQPGCLTTSSDVRIHSCEPGLPCHTALKKNKNIVWITPIISRMRDGTEIAELGAGGGGGDLYQTRDVDLGNDAMIEALRLLCANMAADPEAASRLETALTKAQYHQDHRLVLDGFDPDTELSIKDFVNMLADKDRQEPANRRLLRDANVIHFPYSRHSSYSELRHLVEAFKPKDICPCTVDIESWEEGVSMKELFGDLCSGDKFRYDQIIREEVARRKKDSGTTATAESQPQLDSQRTGTESQPEDSSQVDRELDVFKSAKEYVQGAANAQVEAEEEPATQIYAPQAQDVPNNRTAKERLRDAWRAANNGQDEYFVNSDEDAGDAEPTSEEPPALPQWDPNFDGRTPKERFRDAWRAANDGRDTPYFGSEEDASSSDDELLENLDEGLREDAASQVDLVKRKRAYDAARACLDGDDEPWKAMKLRCLGHEGHTQEEMEL
ncbi:hypothetical protein PMZ80_010094 [Knufia obscura]|uniref:Protein artemis n=2 Tax=Knufia TaxID=430999 RepID=A0AAN8I894_9EURO|nr:hypothetical protein PMZ80_010094 [Knufia obscura]KAK5952835.1 hypothetical protein OHC33_005954 [Knufia fluminis]